MKTTPTLMTADRRIGATIASGQTRVQFIDIEGLSYPLPSREALAAYVVYVGFDDIGNQNEKKTAGMAKKRSALQQ